MTDATRHPAGEEIPFGDAVRLVDGAWRRSSLAAMDAIAARPRWANRRRGFAGADRTSWLPGEPVEIRTEGVILAVLSERHEFADRTVLLAGEKAMVTLRGGRVVA